MSYVLTGVQHLKSGDVVIPALGFETKDAYLQRYHHEMDYAMSNEDFLGLGIKVYDTASVQDVLIDNWVREVVHTESEEEKEE